jgi:hypothetical protein
MYLFGFIIRIYHDARSSECQIVFLCLQLSPCQLVPYLLRYNRKWMLQKIN